MKSDTVRSHEGVWPSHVTVTIIVISISMKELSLLNRASGYDPEVSGLKFEPL